MFSYLSEKLSKSGSRSGLTPEQQDLRSNMGKLREYIFEKAPQTIGPVEITKIRILGNQIEYSTTHGNICKYGILSRKVADDTSFGFPIHNFSVQDDMIAVVGASEFKIFRMPNFELLFSEKLEVTCIIPGFFTGEKSGLIKRWTNEGSEIFLTLKKPVLSIKFSDKYIVALTHYLNFFSISTRELVHKIKDKNFLTFDLNIDIIAAGHDEGITVYELQEFAVIHIFTNKSPCNCVRLTAFSDFLVSGNRDGIIKVYELKQKKSEITLRGHKGSIIQCELSPQGNYIVSISTDHIMKIWSFPEFPEETIFDTGVSVLKVLLLGNSIICCKGDKKVSVYSNGGIEDVLITKGIAMSLVNVNEWILIGDDFGYVYALMIPNYVLMFEMQAHNGAIRGIVIHKDTVITGGADSEINIWTCFENSELKIEKIAKTSLTGHQQAIWTLCIVGDFLISSSPDRTIRVWDLNDKMEVGVINCEINVMEVSSCMITGDFDGKIKIWNVYDLCIESSIEAHMAAVTSVSLVKDFIVSVGLDGILCIISYKYRNLISKIHFKDPILCLAISEFKIITGFKHKMSVRENPLYQDKIAILGPQDLLQNYYGYLKSIYTRLNPSHNQSMDQFVILPYYFNTLHIYCYLNLLPYLNQSLDGFSPLIAIKYSPLSIVISADMHSLKNAICKNILQAGKENPYYFYLLDNHIIQLNLQGSAILYDLYEAAYVTVSRDYLPKMCAIDIIMPKHKAVRYQRIQIEDFLTPEDIADGDNIMFRENYIGTHLNIGSSKSIEFIESLINCPNPQILRASFIQDMVKYKWEVAKYPIFIQAAMYFIYLVLLSVYIEWFNKDLYFLGTLFTLNALLLIYETFQMIVFRSYFKSIWNYLDWARAILLISYAIVEALLIFYNEKSEYEKAIMSLLIISSWIRGISYFRIFNRTRYLIRLLQDSFKNILGFMLCFCYFLFSFAMFNLIIDQNGHEQIVYILQTYSLALGTIGSNRKYDFIQWICLTGAILSLCIIVTNIMVSLISDCFEKVQTDSLSADTQELLEMIYEVENMIFTRRNSNFIMYFHTIDWNFKDNNQTWEGRLRMIAGLVENLYAKEKVHIKIEEEYFDIKTKRLTSLGIKIDRLARHFK